MKRMLVVLAVFALSVPIVAVAGEGRPDREKQEQGAQQQGGGNEDGNRGDQQGRRGGRGGQQGASGRANVNPTPAPQPSPAPQAQGRRGDFQAQSNSRPEDLAPQGSVRGRGNDRRFDDNNNNRVDNNRRGQNAPRFENDGNNNRFDNNRRFNSDRGQVVGRNFGYQRDSRAGRDFRFRGRSFVSVRAPSFAYPRGYSYRRWAVGATLPFLFLSEPYYVDWDYIGLPPPGPGEEWVRYGTDALLVDTYTGRVVDVAYSVFY